MNNPTSKSLPVLPLLALVVLLLGSGSIWRLWVARSAALVAEANWMACRELAEQIVPSGSTRQHNEPLERLVEQAAETTQTEDHLSDVQPLSAGQEDSIQVRVRSVSLPQLFALLRHLETQDLTVQSVLLENLNIESDPGWEAEIILTRTAHG